MSIKVGLIGTGNMGTPIIKGIVTSGILEASKINIFDINTSKAKKLSEETGVNVMCSNTELVENSDIIILAVKPGYINDVLKEIKGSFSSTKVLASIAVGISIDSIKDILGQNAAVVRLMPNIPILVGEGMTLICFDNIISSENKEWVIKLFECSGQVQELEEKLMSEVTALTSSSPAYISIMIEAMADAAVLSGIPRDVSYKLATQAVLGTAKLLQESGMHPAQLKDMVCSPAGTSIEAVQSLERTAFRSSIMEAMAECTKRAREIGKQQ